MNCCYRIDGPKIPSLNVYGRISIDIVLIDAKASWARIIAVDLINERYFQILWMSSDQAASFFSKSVNVTLAITSWISSCWLSLRQVFEAESANL